MSPTCGCFCNSLRATPSHPSPFARPTSTSGAQAVAGEDWRRSGHNSTMGASDVPTHNFLGRHGAPGLGGRLERPFSDMTYRMPIASAR